MNPFDHPLFAFGKPPNLAAWIALGLGTFLLLMPRSTSGVTQLARHSRKLCGALALIAAALSGAYWIWVLGGGPRIIDATAYLCSARILATGAFTFEAPAPSSLFHARFLIHPPDAPTKLGVIFPPGYPAFLAVFERFLDYRLAGPVLAGIITVGTYYFARWVAQSMPRTPSSAPPQLVGVLAAALSAGSIALRYHTADTMSHGFSTALALACGLVVARTWSTGHLRAHSAWLLGTALGALLATRPLTALAVMFPCGLALRAQLRPKTLAAIAIGFAPGLLLLLMHQKALTSELWGSVQLRYYALADGPTSCFGLGFGKGCEFEHGDVVRDRGKLGPLWALLNSLHRLHNHALDLANCELLFAFLLARLIQSRTLAASRFVLTQLASFALLYALFYFDGSYPGGGGRFLIELAPVEHGLLAVFALERIGWSRTLGISTLSFALHGAYSHEALRDRDGGAPFIDQALVAGHDARLVFVESDHAFLAGLRPAVLERSPGPTHLRGTLVARRSHDFRERRLIERLGSPATFLLAQEPPGRELIQYADPSWGTPAAESTARAPLLWEVERDHPLLALEGLWVHPAHLAGERSSCAPSRQALRLRPQAGQRSGALAIWIDGVESTIHQARPVFWSESRGCFSDGDQMLSAPGPLRIEIQALPAEPIYLDRLELEPIDQSGARPLR